MKPNPQEDLKDILDIKKDLYLFEFGTPTKPRNEEMLNYLKKKAKVIAERNEFKGGCGKEMKFPFDSEQPEEGYGIMFCPEVLCLDCQAKKKIQEEWSKIENERI